jgi:hypothetical protein
MLYLVTVLVAVSQGCNLTTEESMRPKPANGDLKPTTE